VETGYQEAARCPKLYMRDHLQKKHPTEYIDYEEKRKVRDLKDKE